MAIDYTKIPAHIICKEKFAAVIEAEEARRKPFQSDPALASEYNKLKDEVSKLNRDKLRIIEELKKGYGFFDFSKTQKAENAFNMMLKEKTEELRKSEAKRTEEAKRQNTYINETINNYNQAIKDFRETEENTFCKKICDNPVYINEIVTRISNFLTYVGDEKRKAQIEHTYYIYVSERYIAYTVCNPSYEHFGSDSSSITFYNFEENGIENLKCNEHITGLRKAILLLIKQNVEKKIPNCMISFSTVGIYAGIRSTFKNPEYIPPKSW